MNTTNLFRNLSLSLIFILTIAFAGYAQEVKFGKVSKDLLTQQTSTVDSTAGAEIVYLHKNIYFDSQPTGYNIITEVHKRIKFYQTGNDDLKQATERIFLYEQNNDREQVSRIKGITFTLEDGELVETDLDNDQVFEEQYNEHHDLVSFTMPNIKPGAVIDIQYKIVSPFFYNIDELTYQFDIPVKTFLGEVTIPKNMHFNKIPKGEILPNVESESIFDHRVNINAERYSYSVENVMPLKKEKYVDNIDNYRSEIVFELVAVKFNSGRVKSYSYNWNDVAKSIAFHNDYEHEITRDGLFKDELDAYLANTSDTLARLKKVLQFAKEHISWNGNYGKYLQASSIRKSYREKTGNVADVNLNLIAMLRHAGFNAVPIVLTTRNYMRPVFPTLSRLNYVIAYVEINKKPYYLDATDSYSEPNILPMRVYNYFGLFVDTPNEIWKQVDLREPPESIKMNFVNMEINPDNGSITGKIKQRQENHYAYRVRKKYYNSSEEDYLREKETDMGKMFISDYENENFDGLGKVEEDFMFKKEDAFTRLNNEILINPLLFDRYSTSPFKAEKRSYPVDFFTPYSDKTVINIKVPDGYKIKSLPESSRLVFGKTIGKFDYLVSGSGKYIRISLEDTMRDARIYSENYESLKTYFDKIVDLQSKQIVLEKE